MYEKDITPGFRGAAYIVQDEEVVLEHISGYRDFANELPNTIDTRFASNYCDNVWKIARKIREK